ncbi:hypothetical protein RB625_15615 [Streptomyces californicus]|uniref:hypothetical protein n=1 Tax=Streptomyces californicus TaxID=67351 RepID=UPI00296F969B|nr:hypothetical protein [Streptomyces californicus]MDW4899840.1 hypothetical protein [Streptomyces californicus]
MPVRPARSARSRSTPPGDSESRGGHLPDATVDGRWLLLGSDGRLAAYARNREGLLRWTQDRPGGSSWTGPVLFPARDLTHLFIAQGANGYVHFLARRAVPKREGPAAVDLVHAVQYQSGRPLTAWRSLGNPHQDREKAERLGVPRGAVDDAGTLHVLVRNAGRGLMLRREDESGKWEGWRDLQGSMFQDAPAVMAAASGLIEVLIPGEEGAGRWVQPEPHALPERAENIPVAIAPGTAVALETAPDRATYYWTDPASGGIVAHRPGGWVIPLGGAPAGPAAALRATLDGYDCTVLAHCDTEGNVMLAACGTENEGAGLWWSPTGERGTGTPGLALDVHGRVVIAALAPDGSLRIARQNDEPGLAMGPSVRV